MKLKQYITFFFVLLFAYSCNSPEKKHFVEKGYCDLSDWDFEKDGIVDLRGEWEFYWNKLIEPSDFKNIQNSDIKYVQLPSLWNGHKYGDIIIDGDGFATLRLHLKVNDDNNILTFRIGRIETAYKLYVNGKLVQQIGTPNTTEETTIPEWKATTVDFNCDTTDLEVVLQIANFHHKKIGTSGTILIGKPNEITKKSNNINYLNIFLIGVLLIISMYHLGLYIQRKQDKASAYFSVFCFSVAIVTMFFGDILFRNLFSDLSWKISINVLFIAYFAGLLAFVFFIYTIFKQYLNKFIIYFFILILSVFIVFTLVTPVKIFTFLMIPYQILALIILLYLLVSLIIATFKKEEGAIFSAIALVIFIGTAINDILIDMVVIKSIYLLPVGTFAFVFLQSYTISLRFSKLYSANELLNIQLNDANLTLEQKVRERTAQLHKQKEELMVQADNLKELNEELNQQKEELKAQSDTLEKAFEDISEKNRKIEEQNQGIKNSIIYAQRIQQALLPVEETFKDFFKDFLVFYKPKDIVSGDFYWLTKINEQILIAVADSTGHGVPGAFVSMLGISILNEIVRYKDIDTTDKVLNQMRNHLKASLKQKYYFSESKDGFDIAFCSIDTKTNIMEYSGANSPIYIIRENSPEKQIKSDEKKNLVHKNLKLFHIKSNRQPVGVYFNEQPFTSQKIQLLENDVIVMFTDGFSDQFNPDNTSKFYSKTFKELLLSIQTKTFAEQKTILSNVFTKWKGENVQIDDVLVVAIKI